MLALIEGLKDMNNPTFANENEVEEEEVKVDQIEEVVDEGAQGHKWQKRVPTDKHLDTKGVFVSDMFHNKIIIKLGKVSHAMQSNTKYIEDGIDILMVSLGKEDDSKENIRKKTKFKKELKAKQEFLSKILSVFNDEGNESFGASVEDYDNDENTVKSLQLMQGNFKSPMKNHARDESENILRVPST